MSDSEHNSLEVGSRAASPVDVRCSVADSGGVDGADAETNSCTSAVLAAKSRASRELSLKAKQNKVIELKSDICKFINGKLTHYENIFSNSQNVSISELESYVNELEKDESCLTSLCKELEKFLDEGVIDSTTQSMCDSFHIERLDNVTFLKEQVKQLLIHEEEMHSAALQKAEAELQMQMVELEKRKKRQAAARRHFELGQQTAPIVQGIIGQDTLLPLHKSSVEELSSPTSSSVNDGLDKASPIAHINLPRERVRSHRGAPELFSAPMDAAVQNKCSELQVVSKLAESITASMRASKRTVVEPFVFSGNVLEFSDWESDFDDFLRAEGIVGLRMHRMLKKYVDGEAKKAIDGFLMNNTLEAYNDARKYLKERYGRKTNIAKVFKQELANWPKIHHKDSHGLQQFADFLSHCCSAMKSIPHLSGLDEPEQNEALLEKLPDWVVNKWKYKVIKHEEEYDCFPPFSEFKDFVVNEAKAANVFQNKGSPNQAAKALKTQKQINANR
jgi:hypothetical protein